MRKLLQRTEFFLVLLIVLIGIVFTLLNPKFATIGNLLDLIKSYSFFGILSVGVLVVLLSGGIDISFTAIAQVAEYVSVGVFWIGMVILTAWILKYTVLGRSIYALGGSQIASIRVGFNIFKTRLFVYSFMGFVSGFAAVVHTALVQSAIPNSIVGRELDVIAAVVLGGANIMGGSGSLLGTCLGVALLAMLGNGLTLIGMSSYWNNVMVGLVLLVGVTISAVQRNLQFRRRVTKLNA
jgi:ribose/xylose/arabinose/galactoside ABC-type transport system permease subunit